MDTKDFDAFFKPYSKNVDSADKLKFWKLSDTIIERVITNHIPPETVSADSVILDAGGGTGRWVVKLAESYPSNFVLYDLSTDMLAQAKENISEANLADRITLVEGDLANMEKIADASVNHIVSIYSPLSFVDEPQKVIDELYRVLKPGGTVLIMGHGFYNALYSKIMNYQARPEELRDMESTSMVKWAPHVPKLQLFSKERMESLLTASGFSIATTYGIPSFTQPGPEDFDQNNEARSRISTALEDEAFFEAVLSLELKYSSLPEVANRGVNIFSVAKKI